MLVLESQHDPNHTNNSFTIDLGITGHGDLKDVCGFELVSLQITPSDNVSSIAPIANASVYVLLNDYKNIITGIASIPQAFARVTIRNNNIIDSDVQVGTNPWVYVAEPVINRVAKFKVSLVTMGGQPYNVNGNNVVVSLLVHSSRTKYSRV